jgi:small subunit ribosomal protein S8
MVRHDTVEMPASKLKVAVLKILKEEGFISDYEVIKGKPERLIRGRMKSAIENHSMISGFDRVSETGSAGISTSKKLPRVYGGSVSLSCPHPKVVVTDSMTGKRALGERFSASLVIIVNSH